MSSSDPDTSPPPRIAKSDNLKVIATRIHKATGRALLSDATRGERDRMFAAAATAWLIMSAGNPNQALESLLDIKQGNPEVLSTGILAVVAYFWCTFLVGSWTDLTRWGGELGETLFASLDGSSSEESSARVAQVLLRGKTIDDIRSMRLENVGQDVAKRNEEPDAQFRYEEAIRGIHRVRTTWWRFWAAAFGIYMLVPAVVGIVTIVQMIRFLDKLR